MADKQELVQEEEAPPCYSANSPYQGYPTQPPPMYPPHTVPPQPPVVVIRPDEYFREYPIEWTCQNCHATALTHTSYVPGLMTWLCVLLLFLFGCWLGCFIIPFFIDSCRDVVHTCPVCHMVVGKYNRMK